jgi:hypothetical protein
MRAIADAMAWNSVPVRLLAMLSYRQRVFAWHKSSN